jgi:formylglycine-generating enzyme required for sulfatase activity/class 3 adenylate cyclase
MTSKGDKPAGAPELVLRTFLFSDIVSSTAIRDECVRRYGRVQGNEKYRREVLEPHDGRLKERFEAFGGEVVSGEGDSYFAVFRDARQAVQCAVAIQDSLAGDPISIAEAGDRLPHRVQVRIGIHTGSATPIERGGRSNYDGDIINIAHRIQEYTLPDQILTSRQTWNDAGEIEGIKSAEYPGYRFKGVQETWTLVEVVWGEREPQAPPRRAEALGQVDTHAQTRVDLERVRDDYLGRLITAHEWLDFAGVPQVRNVVRLKLEDVFVPLSATKELPEGDVLREHLVPRAAKGEAGDAEARLAHHEAAERRITLEGALKEPLLVVLGEPGSGKTSILKHVALKLAKGLGSELGLGAAEDLAPLPILFPVSAYAVALRQGDRALSDYLAEHFAAHEQPGLAPLFADALARGHTIVLLDGLDEVLDAGERVQVVRRVQEFVRRFSTTGIQEGAPARGNRFVVTSRIAGYETARLGDFAHVTVLPFGDDEVRRFCGQWCRAWERVADESPAADERAGRRARDLVDAIGASDNVKRLATNPLLLTIIALIHYQNVRLPERRVELYRLAVEALAESWNRARSLGGRAIDLYLGDRRLDARFVVNVLGRVALWIHANQPGGLVEQRALEAKLAETLCVQEGVSDARARELAHAFLDLVRRGSGLLQERGLGLYGFLHLTFEEYLAARAIADLEPDPTVGLLEHWHDAAWREVVLLAVCSSGPTQATRLVDALLKASADGDLRGKNVVLAAQALADVGREGVVGGIWQKIVAALVALIDERDPSRRAAVRTRADAGDVLGLLGDPRIADDTWVEVPAGEFLMGTTPEEVADLVGRYGERTENFFKREGPRHQLNLGPFRIGKWPVTNREFKRFIEAGGYEAREHWSDDGWKWLHRPAEDEESLPSWPPGRGRSEPAFWQDPNFGARRPNRPVVGVAWYEPQAYCHWLTGHLRSTGKLGAGEVVTLPSEAEWEKAARGAHGRRWPWGNQWDPSRANTLEGKVRTTTPVGIYLDGESPYHALDMAGNVQEWTRSVYKLYPYKPDDGREDPESDEDRCLRGGAWFFSADYARSAYRNGGKPGFAFSSVGFRCVVVPHAALPG